MPFSLSDDMHIDGQILLINETAKAMNQLNIMDGVDRASDPGHLDPRSPALHALNGRHVRPEHLGVRSVLDEVGVLDAQNVAGPFGDQLGHPDRGINASGPLAKYPLVSSNLPFVAPPKHGNREPDIEVQLPDHRTPARYEPPTQGPGEGGGSVEPFIRPAIDDVSPANGLKHRKRAFGQDIRQRVLVRLEGGKVVAPLGESFNELVMVDMGTNGRRVTDRGVGEKNVHETVNKRAAVERGRNSKTSRADETSSIVLAVDSPDCLSNRARLRPSETTRNTNADK